MHKLNQSVLKKKSVFLSQVKNNRLISRFIRLFYTELVLGFSKLILTWLTNCQNQFNRLK